MSAIQSVVFDRRYWDVTRARKWLRKNKLKADGKVDRRENELRFRQHDPKDFERYITKHAQPSVRLIVGFY